MMMANTGGAAANTVIDNAVYGENESVGDAMFTSVSRPKCPKSHPPFPRRIFETKPPIRRDDFFSIAHQRLAD
jgi:hypothetical protein